MSTFRVLDQAPQYLLPNGQVNAGGSLLTFESDLATPKITWADPDKSTPNPTTIDLDAAGRTETDVWGEGEYGLVLKGADGVTIWTRNNVQAGGDPGQTIPDLSGNAGEFLTNDGSNLQWAAIREVPDPTGSADYVLSTDGTNLIWVQQQEIPEPDIEVSTASLTVGEGSGERFSIQTGTGTIPAAASRTSTANITFGTAFTKILAVVPMASTYAVNEYGAGATITAEGFTVGSAASGATVRANIVDDGGDSGDEIVNPVSFTYVAFGLVAAA